jgi:hypothetical protein
MSNGKDGSMGDDVRRRALEEMERLLDAAHALQRDLEEHEEACRRIIAEVRAGEELGAVLESAHSDKLRPQLTDSMNNFERLRHKARIRVIALGVAEGMTTADIQRHWSITRQLASRAKREIETLD